MNESSTTLPPKPAIIEAEQVLHLPGYLFFVECVDLPPALEGHEVADFAELTVESIAPFPLEQLYWGFLYAVDTTSILIYAAHRDRLKKYGANNIDAYAWVLPDFASLQGAHFPEATEITLLSEESIAILHVEGGSEIPSAVVAQPNHGGNPARMIEAIREELDDSANFPRKLALRLVDSVINENGIPTFHYVEEGTNNGVSYGKWNELSTTEKTLWQADIRSSNFKKTERSTRRTSALLTKITAWAALFALLLVGLEIVLLAGKAWLGTQTDQIAAQKPAIALLEEKQAFMNKVEQVAPENELRPIAVLEALNTTRPAGIYFTSTETEGENRITIDGIASTINDFNRYTGSLKVSGIFELVGDPKQITRSGKTTFTVTLDYKHRETAQPSPQSTPEADPEAAELESALAADLNEAMSENESPQVTPRRKVIVDPEELLSTEEESDL